jgi:hypothetical protein
VARTTLPSLTAREQQLVAETEPGHLRTLDEDQLGELVGRVRRVRDKQVTLHRQEVRARTISKQARGAAAQPSRAAWKAEVFEEAVARASAALARAARASAASLKAERLAAARGSAATPPSTARGVAATEPPPPRAVTRSRQARPIEKKAAASTAAAGARRQAKRDSR